MNLYTIYEDHDRMKNESKFVFPMKIKSVNLGATKIINNDELIKKVGNKLRLSLKYIGSTLFLLMNIYHRHPLRFLVSGCQPVFLDFEILFFLILNVFSCQLYS